MNLKNWSKKIVKLKGSKQPWTIEEKNRQIELVKIILNNLTKKLSNWMGQNKLEQFDEKTFKITFHVLV